MAGRPAGFREASVAHQRAYDLFSRDFLSRHRGGWTGHDLDYIGATTRALKSPSPIQISGRPEINRVLDAMAADYRRYLADADYRKSDAIGIARTADYGELLEVTTTGNMSSAAKQLRDKLDTLRLTVNRTTGLHTDWQPTPWRPQGIALTYPVDEESIITFEPTYTNSAPRGVVLYEVWQRERVKVPQMIADPAPRLIQDSFKDRDAKRLNPLVEAQRFLDDPAIDTPRLRSGWEKNVDGALQMIVGAALAAGMALEAAYLFALYLEAGVLTGAIPPYLLEEPVRNKQLVT